MTTVAIVIAARNAASTLDAAIKSIVAQTYSDWEAVIVDDGSSDQTIEIANAWSHRDRRICVKSNNAGGVSSARNLGVTSSYAPWILFLDSDDLIVRHHLTAMMTAALSGPSPGIIYAASARLTPNNRLSRVLTPPSVNHFEHLGFYNCFCTHATMIRRSVFEDLGGFDNSLVASEDWDLWQRAARANVAMTGLNDCLAYYRMRPHSLSRRAPAVFSSAKEVILRARAPDSRVRNPDPAYASGLAPITAGQAVLDISLYCAGMIIGQNDDPASFLETICYLPVDNSKTSNAAAMLQGGVPAGACAVQEDWPLLWPQRRDRVAAALDTLEKRLALPDFASRTMKQLEERTGDELRRRPQLALRAPSTPVTQETADLSDGETFLRTLGSTNDTPIMMIVAHPDDDIIGAGAQLRHWSNISCTYVTDGAPHDVKYAQEAGFQTSALYAAARRQEARSALALAGRIPQVDYLSEIDQEVTFRMVQLAQDIRRLVENRRPRIIITHPYEGGHPDHDATCLAVHAACAALAQDGFPGPTIIELGSYFGAEGRRMTGTFIEDNSLTFTILLNDDDRALKERMLGKHVSQRELLQEFPANVECLREAPAYDFTRPPHPGKLLYEYYNLGIDGARWRSEAVAALTQLGLTNPL